MVLQVQEQRCFTLSGYSLSLSCQLSSDVICLQSIPYLIAMSPRITVLFSCSTDVSFSFMQSWPQLSVDKAVVSCNPISDYNSNCGFFEISLGARGANRLTEKMINQNHAKCRCHKYCCCKTMCNPCDKCTNQFAQEKWRNRIRWCRKAKLHKHSAMAQSVCYAV